MQAMQERLTKIRSMTEVVYTLDTLEYLARGGRIGRVKAIAGALLHLKPVIRVDTDGKYSTVTRRARSARDVGDRRASSTRVLQRAAVGDRSARTIREQAQALAMAEGEVERGQARVRRISPVLGCTRAGRVGAAVLRWKR